MILFKLSSHLSNYLGNEKATGKKIGFVPTMGALHSGHISLINTCKEKNDITVCSIFINPTQFNNKEDLKKYPVTIEHDIDLLEKAGCDVLFLPEVIEIYPARESKVHYDIGQLENIMEGKYRPGHFQGVCQVVDKLLQIIKPTTLYLGQKDYQQCLVLEKLVELKHIQTKVEICPTERETSGLAMSSRNMRLTATEKQQASKIYETLTFIKEDIKAGSLHDIKKKASDYLTSAGFKVDYVELADTKTLITEKTWDGKKPLIALIAAYLNEIRLIDNLMIYVLPFHHITTQSHTHSNIQAFNNKAIQPSTI